MAVLERSLNLPLSEVLAILQERIVGDSTYLGVPTQKNPLDFWILQEILWDTRPDVIVEIGNFCGGSALALAHLCDALDQGRVIAVDINHDRLFPQVRAHPRITLLTGDACELLSTVRRSIAGAEEAMVIEDSSHTYGNTLRVLEHYAELVAVGKYFVVEDGICHHGLDVGPKPGPYEAVEQFVSTSRDFVIDRDREAYCITWNPKGYLKKVR